MRTLQILVGGMAVLVLVGAADVALASQTVPAKTDRNEAHVQITTTEPAQTLDQSKAADTQAAKPQTITKTEGPCTTTTTKNDNPNNHDQTTVVNCTSDSNSSSADVDINNSTHQSASSGSASNSDSTTINIENH